MSTQYYHPEKRRTLGDLPRELVINGRLRTDPENWTRDMWEGEGWQEAPEPPAYDDATQTRRWDSEQLAYVVEDLPPPPSPQPRELTLREFMRLCVEAGGAALSDLATVKSDDNLNLRGMWELLSAGTTVVKDDPDTQTGLALLESEGYLPNGAQAVLDAWPTA